MSVRWKGGRRETIDTRRTFVLCRYCCQSFLMPIQFCSIVEQFKNLGYIEEDIMCIKVQREVDQDTELTDRSKCFLAEVFHLTIPYNHLEVWNRILPILEPFVQHKKADRLARERAALIHNRTRIVDSVYKSYLKTLLPSQWAFHPCVAEVCKFSPFDALVQAPDEVTVNAASFAEAVVMLPGLVATWMQERRQMLLDMLSASSKHSADATSSSGGGHTLLNVAGSCTTKIAESSSATDTTSSSYTPPGTVDRLSLATSVFMCGSTCSSNNSSWGGPGSQYSNALIAWDGIHTHQCQERVVYYSSELRPWGIPSVYQFSVAGSAAAVTLVSLAGLKPSSATPRDMDQRDLRFFCKSCGPRGHARGSYGRDVYTWRSAVCLVLSY
jgi:hypothetical protein